MYHFSYFKEQDKQKLLGFIQSNPFAFLTGSYLDGKQVATQIPVLLVEKEGEFVLQGHFMRNTDHHKAFSENPQTLLVFTGPHCYVSASWYSNPQIGATWNYMSVHVCGEMRFMSDAELVQFMRKLSLAFEDGNTESPCFYDKLPEHFLEKMMPAIVGFELKLEKLDNVFKLSQNRDEQSYLNIISQLKKRGGNSSLIAAEMEERKAELFPSGFVWDASKFDS